MGSLLSDIRFAVRSILRRPGFALLSVLVLAIGIGAVTVMFSTLNAVILRPLPFPESDRLVWCWSTTESGNNNSTSAVDYYDYRERNDVFSSLAAHLVWTPGQIVTGEGEPERVPSTVVSRNFFETFATPPLLGRSFTAEESVEGGPNAVILSYGFWQRKRGGDLKVLGQDITIDGDLYEIVGVMPKTFDYPADVALWFPMRKGGNVERSRGNRNFFMIGRLRDGITLEQARSQFDALALQLSEEYPDVNRNWGARLQPLHDRFVGRYRLAMWILMGSVTLLLLIACANLSSLLLAKVTARSNELAVRFSLGASRWVIVKQLLVESLVVTLIGSVAGVALAFVGNHAITSYAGGQVRQLAATNVDKTVLVFAAVVSITTGLLFSIVPALRSTRIDLVPSLKEGAQSTETAGSLNLRHVLVVGQITLSLMLLIASGLLIKSLYRLQNTYPGFNARGVLTMNVQLPAFRYEEDWKQEQFFSDALDRIRTIPGIVEASAVSGLPLRGGPWNYIHRADRPAKDYSEMVPGVRRRAMEGYFRTLEIPLLAGRTFRPSDRLGSQQVVIISKTFAETAFPNEDPIGKDLVLPWNPPLYMNIIGVVDDLKDDGLAAANRPVFYMPFRQMTHTNLNLVLRTEGEPTSYSSTVRDLIWDLDRDAPISAVSTLSVRLSESTFAQRFQAILLGTFAAIALILTAIGLYGVLAYFVSQRTRELGIRMALGANAHSILLEVAKKGLVLAGIGIVLGLGGGLAASRLLQSLLYETHPMDVTTYVFVSVFLATVALAASLVPALRAVKINPVEALKTE
jgi:predicted permease